MGKVIKKKLNGMSWWMKTSLVLLLTLATTVFMYQGWYKPAPAQAATVTYGVTVPNVLTTGIDGLAQFPTGGTSVTTAPTVRGNMSTTLTTSGASYRPTTGMTSGTPVTMLKFYSPAYASAQTITAPVGSFAIRGYNASDTWTFHVYSHNPAGTAGNKTLMFSSNTTTSGTGATVVVAPTYTTVNSAMPSGYKLLVEVVYTPGGTVYTPRIYIDGTANTSWCRLTVTETAAATAGTLAVSVGTQTVAEAVGNATVSVTRTGGTTGAVTVDYATADGTGLAGQDYTSTTGTLSWAAGDATAKTITIPITNDIYDEGNETFAVNLTNATNGASLGTATQTVTITDDDATPTIGFTATTSTANKTVTPATFTVSLSSVSALSTSVAYSTTNGTAAAGTDYTATSGTLTIPALSPSGTISVPISAASNGGTFTVTITTPTNSTLRAGFTTHTYTITSTAASTINNCAGCHGYKAPLTFLDGASRNDAGKFQGSHNNHVIGNSMNCSACHVVPASELPADNNHSTGTIQMATPISGGTYVRGTSFAQSNTFSPTACNTTTCHGASSPTWGNNTANATCTKCHGVSGTLPAAYTADPETAAPGYLTTGRDTGGVTVATDAEVGAHDTHLRGLNTISNPVACTECHANVNTTNAAFTGHMDGAGSVNFGTIASSGTGTAPSYNGTGTCSNTYCHFGRSTAPPATASANVVWNNTAYMSGVDTAAADCGKCHASPPETSSNHTALMTIADCNGCHNHVNTSGVFTNAALHVNGIVESQAECISCHAVSVTTSAATRALDATVLTRRAITPDFAKTQSHKRSGAGAITNEDCGVCHMEGTSVGGAVNASFHKNGRVELRDPDTGLTIKGVTWSNTPAGAGSYASTATDAAPVRFSRNLGALESTTNNVNALAIQINQCLHCHDTLGATNSTAWVTGGSALRPFNTTVTANGNRVLDVSSQFAATNRTYHPILGKQNNSYANSVRMNAPWNLTKTTGNSTSWGALMTCWDCHAPSGTTTTTTLTATDVHGSTITAVTNAANSVELRGVTWRTAALSATNNTTLCIICHKGYDTSATSNHSTGSAITSNTNGSMSMYMRYACTYCHASSPTKPARPLASGDVHGYNTQIGGAALATNFGYSFIRSAGFVGTYTWVPGNCTGYTSQTNGTTACSRTSMGTYTPGGTY